MPTSFAALLRQADATPPDLSSLRMVAAGEPLPAPGLVKPRAYVVRQPAAPADGLEEALRAHVRSRLAPFKTPRWVTFVDALPRTDTGKVQRYRLRRG